MTIRVIRIEATEKSTIGLLLLDGRFVSYVLEDAVHVQQDGGAIPTGTYPVAITESVRFKKRLPLLLDVPGRSGIRIHPGNTAEDTTGCLLPGLVRGVDLVYESIPACERIQARIQTALDRNEPVRCVIEEVL